MATEGAAQPQEPAAVIVSRPDVDLPHSHQMMKDWRHRARDVGEQGGIVDASDIDIDIARATRWERRPGAVRAQIDNR